MKTIELRIRSPRAPDGEFRLFLGRSAKPSELAALRGRREFLRRLAQRGEWDVLLAVKSGGLSVEELERVVDQYGIRDYRAHVDLTPPPESLALKEHAAAFLERVAKKGTRNTYRKGLAYLIEYEVDGEPLGERDWHLVRKHHVQDLSGKMRGTLSAATVQTYMAAWSAFFSWAVDREESHAEDADREPLIQVNPVTRARSWPKVSQRRERWLDYREFDALLDASPPYMRAQYATLALAGLRVGELMAMPTMHVFPESHVKVAPWGGWGPKGWPEITRGIRDVPVHQERLRPLLVEYAEKWAGDVYFFVNPRTGEGWHDWSFRTQFQRDAKAAGLEVGIGARKDGRQVGVTPHSLRHTFASWLALEDVQLMKIAALMGDTEAIVRDHYAHLLPTDLDRTVQRLFSSDGVRLSDRQKKRKASNAPT